MRFLALGDSYTIGEGVDHDAGWPMQLTKALRVMGVDVEPPKVVARTGWTTQELWAGIAEQCLASDFDLVTLLVGVNNQYRGLSVECFAQEFESLLTLGVRFAKGTAQSVIALSIPDYGGTPFAAEKQLDAQRIRIELDRFNAAAASVARKLGTHWMDVTSLSRSQGIPSSMLAADGLHPNGRMYAAWTDAILPVAYRALAIAAEPR